MKNICLKFKEKIWHKIEEKFVKMSEKIFKFDNRCLRNEENSKLLVEY